MDVFVLFALAQVDRGEDLEWQRCLSLVQDRSRAPAGLLSRMSHPSLLSSRPRHTEMYSCLASVYELERGN
jgi:hypothetical protein